MTETRKIRSTFHPISKVCFFPFLHKATEKEGAKTDRSKKIFQHPITKSDSWIAIPLFLIISFISLDQESTCQSSASQICYVGLPAVGAVDVILLLQTGLCLLLLPRQVWLLNWAKVFLSATPG